MIGETGKKDKTRVRKKQSDEEEEKQNGNRPKTVQNRVLSTTSRL